MRLAATPLLIKVIVASLTITATMTGVAIRLASTKPDRYLVGLTNNEGLGAMLSHIGCYAALAHGSTRRLVVVPQYESSHYPEHPPNEEAVMDYAKYIRLDKVSPGYVRWQDVPERVRADVRLNPDGVLLSNIMQDTPELRTFRLGPDPEDYPHLSREAWESYQRTRPCGKNYCDAESFGHLQAIINRRRGQETVVAAARIANVCPTPPLVPTPYLLSLVDEAVRNLVGVEAAHGGSGGTGTGTGTGTSAATTTKTTTTTTTKTTGKGRSVGASASEGTSAGLAAVLGRGGGGYEDGGGALINLAAAGDKDKDEKKNPEDEDKDANLGGLGNEVYKLPMVVMHWRRGDKCDGKDFDGLNRANRCGSPVDERTLAACARFATAGRPVYIASDEENPEVIAKWRAKGCKTFADTGLSGKVTAADAMFVDLMLMARAARMWSLGDSSIDDVVGRDRARRGQSPVTIINKVSPPTSAYAVGSIGEVQQQQEEEGEEVSKIGVEEENTLRKEEAAWRVRTLPEDFSEIGLNIEDFGQPAPADDK